MRIARKNLLKPVLALSIAFPFPAMNLLSQTVHPSVNQRKSTYAPTLAAEVTSIRESEPAVHPSQYFSNPARSGRIDALNIFVNQLIGDAFGINFRYQIAGGPEWISQQRFTVHARANTNSDSWLASLTEDQAKEEKRHMLRQILQERFSLKSHFGEKEGLTYYLKRDKASPNLQAKPSSSADSAVLSSGVPTDVVLTAKNASMTQLVSILSYYLKAPVVDQTELKSWYDFRVHFNARPELQEDTADSGPLPEKALSEQLGLKLIRGKGPIQTIIIDSINKPTPN